MDWAPHVHRWPDRRLFSSQIHLHLSASLASRHFPMPVLMELVPQLRSEHSITFGRKFESAAAGRTSSIPNGEPPVFDFYRHLGRGRSRPPAYATRVAGLACVRTATANPAEGYYRRHSYGFGRNVDAWSGMTTGISHSDGSSL